MVDPLDLEHFERFLHVGRRPFFTGMGDDVETELARTRKNAGKLCRRIADFARIEADAIPQVGVPGAQGQRRVERGKGVALGQMTQETENHARREAVLGLGGAQGPGDAGEHGGHGDAAHGMRLRVEKKLDVTNIVSPRALDVGGGQVEEVLLGLQHGSTGVVEVEEGLQIGKLVGGAHFLHRSVRQGDAVLAGEREHHFRLERTLDVQMQLGLGQAADKVVQGNWIHGSFEKRGQSRKAADVISQENTTIISRASASTWGKISLYAATASVISLLTVADSG